MSEINIQANGGHTFNETEDLLDWEFDEEEPSESFESSESSANSSEPTSTDNPVPTSNGLAELAAAMRDLVASQAATQQQLTTLLVKTQKNGRRKCLVDKPSKFEGKIGDYVDTWLEGFEAWFEHVEDVDGELTNKTKIQTAVQTTAEDLRHQLTQHQKTYGVWSTWDDFADHMRRTYSSKETGFTKYLRLRTLQGSDSVNGFYGHFRSILNKQKQSMADAKDNFVYNYMFLEHMNSELQAQVLSFPEARELEALRLEDVLELAKRAETVIQSRKTVSSNKVSYAGPQRKHEGSKLGSNLKKNYKMDKAALSDNEKSFLKMNIARGGGLWVRKNVQMKSQWQEWARKENLCTRCCARGHSWQQCAMKEPTHKREQLNSMPQGNNSTSASFNSDEMEVDIDMYSTCEKDVHHLYREHFNAIGQKTKNTLLIYHGKVKKRRGKVLFDTGATRNYISKKFALECNIKFKENLGNDAKSVLLPNNALMKVLGYCEIDLELGEWTGTIPVIILDMNADFDIVLGMEWILEEQPMPDWSTLDWYIMKSERTLRIPHPKTAVSRLLKCKPRLTVLQPDPTELTDLKFTCISYKEAQKELDRGGQAILHYARLYKEDREPEEGLPFFGAFQEFENLKSKELKELLEEYSDVFLNELPPGLPHSRTVDHTIDTGNETPVNRAPYALTPHQLAEQIRQIDDLLKRGLIRESSSPWGAPVLFIAKKTPGEWRMCIDYRMLNSKTIKNAYPLPRIQDCIDRLGKAKYLSSLDLTSGYWQVRVANKDIPKTAFNTRYGKYEFLVMPFGLTNAPATFQTLMNSILRRYIDRFVLVYLDDILIYSKSEEEHREHLRLVFQALREHKLYARPLKCFFNQPTVEFCGHLVGQGVVKVLPDKVEAIKSWPIPKTVHEVRQFYGLVNYYHCFIRNFSIVGAPLSDLFKITDDDKRKSRPVEWNTSHQMAFDALKTAVTTAPVLINPDPNKPFTIETDSSDFGNGMALLQEGADGKMHPVAFDGRKLHGAELNYPTHEKELLAIKDALTKWRIYVLNGKPITVITDHDSLKYMNTIKKPSKHLARWLDEFQEYTLDIKYRPGPLAVVPDAISRRPDFKGLTSDAAPIAHTFFNTIQMENRDSYINYVRAYLENYTLPDEIQDHNMRAMILEQAEKFILIEDPLGNILHRKIRDGVTAPYIEPLFPEIS